MSEFTKARENFEKAASLDFGNIGIMLLLADLDIREGNFASAENAYAEALTSSKTAEDSASVFTNLNTYFAMKGQILESLNYFEKSMDKFARYLSPFASNQQYLFAMDKYVLAGRSDQGLKLLKTLENKFQPPFDKIISLGYLTFYIERDDANEADKYLTELMNLINSLGQESLLIHADYARGQIAEIRKDYKTALENYIKVNQRMPGEYDPYVWVARCQRELGNYKEAKKSIDQALKMHPYDPKNNYEAAMVYLHLDDKQKAKEYLDRALEVWKDADTNYPPYQQALSAKNNLMTTL